MGNFLTKGQIAVYFFVKTIMVEKCSKMVSHVDTTIIELILPFTELN